MGGHSTPEVQHQAPGEGDELRRLVNDLLQHRLYAPALGRMANRRDFAGQAQLPKEAQAVVGEGRQMQQTIVGVELARRQSLQIQVGLEFGMELLVHPVMLVQLDDLRGLGGQSGLSAFQFNVGHLQTLALIVDGAFDHPSNQAEGALLLTPDAFHGQMVILPFLRGLRSRAMRPLTSPQIHLHTPSFHPANHEYPHIR